jgi:hypothetical protein
MYASGLVSTRGKNSRRRRTNIASGAGIPIPIPRPSKIARLIDNLEVRDAGLHQRRRHQQPAEPSTQNQKVRLDVHRLTLDARRVRIREVVLQVLLEAAVLLVAVRPQALVALGVVALLERGRVELHLRAQRRRDAADGWCRCGSRLCCCWCWFRCWLGRGGRFRRDCRLRRSWCSCRCFWLRRRRDGHWSCLGARGHGGGRFIDDGSAGRLHSATAGRNRLHRLHSGNRLCSHKRLHDGDTRLRRHHLRDNRLNDNRRLRHGRNSGDGLDGRSGDRGRIGHDVPKESCKSATDVSKNR